MSEVLERFKMCMAEAGFPQPNAYMRDGDGDGAIFMEETMWDDSGFVEAVWRACRLAGDPFMLMWCLPHYLDAVETGLINLPDTCPCHGD